MISRRQILFLLAFVFPVAKLVMLPASLADHAGNDLLLPALLHIVLQAAAVFCVLLLAKRRMSFYELLENTFGRVIACILITLYSLFLLFAGVLPLLEQKLFVQAVFYDTLPSILAFAPFFLFLAYVVSKPLGSYGRVWDILAPLSIVGIAGILILSVAEADYGALLPAGAAGGSGFFEAVRASSGWFYDAALLLPMLKKFEYKKGLALQGLLCSLAGGAVVLFFLATFYGIYEGTAVNQLFALAATSKYFSGISMLGRIDYLFIFSLSLVLAFLGALPIQGAAECLLQAYGRKRYVPTLLAVLFAAILFAVSVLLDFRFGDALLAFAQVFWIYPLFSVAIPALMLLLRRNHA